MAATVNCKGIAISNAADLGLTLFASKSIPTITPPPIMNCKKYLINVAILR